MKDLRFYPGLLLISFTLIAGCQSDGLLEPGEGVDLEELFTSDEAEVLRQDPDIVLRLLGVKFSAGKTDLTEPSLNVLNKLKTVFENFEGAAYSVEAHTDSRASSIFNQRLSQERANVIKDYFVMELSVDGSLITAIGYGETRPLETNDTAAGRARNRRVEFIIHPAK